MERTFCEYFHYKKDSGTAGLDASQVRLLHSSWSRFASSDGLLANVLHLPQRLSEAGANIGVRHDLAGAALGILSDALMRMIEEEHERLIILSRLIERLNLQLAVADDEEDSIQQRLAASSPGPASAPRSPSTVVPTSDRPAPETSSLIMEVLALSNEQARQIQRVLRRLAGTRALLVQATQYGHLLGRFLIKRHRRVMELRKGIHTHRIGGITKGKSETSVPVRQ